MALDKKTIKRKLHGILHYENTMVHSTFNEKNFSKALKSFAEKDPENLSSFRSLGKRKDNKDFYPEIKKIDKAYNLLYRDIEEYNDKNIPPINEWFSIRNGNPIRHKPFPLCREYMLKSIFSRHLYIYPTSVQGESTCRASVVNYLEKEGFQINKTDNYDGLGIENIVFTYSTSHAYNMIVNAIARPGDVILMTGPNYGIFASFTEIDNARLEVIPLREEDDFYINPKLLGKRIDEINAQLKKEHAKEDYIPHVVAFLNMNPHNPLGKVLNRKKKDLLEELGDICLEKGVFIIDDLIYRDIGFDQEDKAFFLASIPKYFNNTITLIGLSKSYGLAQVRAGAIIAPIPICNDLSAQLSHEVDGFSQIQSAALAGAFNGTTRRYRKAKKYFKTLMKKYHYQLNLIEALIYGIDYEKCSSNRKKIMKDIKKYTNDPAKIKLITAGTPGLKIRAHTYPEAGFFIVGDFTELKGKRYKDMVINNDEDFVKYIYLKTKINFLIGLSFSWPNEDEIVARINFAIDKKDLIHNLYLINKAVRELQ